MLRCPGEEYNFEAEYLRGKDNYVEDIEKDSRPNVYEVINNVKVRKVVTLHVKNEMKTKLEHVIRFAIYTLIEFST